MAYDKQRVIDIALAEVGYLEKASNAQLDSMTANAGKKNYTKYARDLDAMNFYNGRKNGFAWCDVFVDWCFVKAFGKEAALAITFQPTNPAGNCGAGCKYSRNYYKSKGRLYDTPQPGDQIFFYSSDKSSIAHTGLVYKVDSSKVYTVEGNTSSSSGVVANGGCVRKKSYALTYSRIAGYGRPNWGTETASGAPVEKVEQKPVQNAGTAQTGQNGGKSCTVELNVLKNGSFGNQVKTLQRLLNALGYSCGDVDGSFGPKTKTAVKKFQKAVGLDDDGSCGPLTWTAILTKC